MEVFQDKIQKLFYNISLRIQNSKAAFLKLKHASKSPGLGWGPKVCIYNKFPGYVDAPGPGATLGRIKVSSLLNAT